MKYQITTQSKDTFWITEEEAQNIANGDLKGLVFVPSIKGYLNLSYIISVVPQDVAAKNAIEGRLHDGTKVVKRFGVWVDANNPSLTLNKSYYPELAEDTVMTEMEYKQKQEQKLLDVKDIK